ncbi:uncharacterized protein LOC132310349 [Cornus florida]|uniref:uncharacterized protein LOC132310349 n=1 Tax=Cornus florida TaxID=4283 RepID=UPI002899CC4B|nr:uncharacterized protein LOC132310349 [Cornus florida]
MASALPENWSHINGSDDFDQFEVPEINTALLMSLLEESQVEECDDERLRSVIQSLEAVIDPNRLDGHDSLVEMEWGSGNLNGCTTPSDGEQLNGQDCSTSLDLDFSWMDVEMVPSSPSDEMTNWYMDSFRDGTDGVIELGDYSQICYGMPLEEHEYGSLWQESHSSVMYD